MEITAHPSSGPMGKSSRRLPEQKVALLCNAVGLKQSASASMRPARSDCPCQTVRQRKFDTADITRLAVRRDDISLFYSIR